MQILQLNHTQKTVKLILETHITIIFETVRFSSF